MFIYEVFDGDEYEAAFETKREAIATARIIPHAVVTRVRIGKLTKSLVCALVNHEGYALSQEEIYRNDDPTAGY